MDRASLLRIERMNYILGGVIVAAAAVLGTGEQLIGAAVGVVVSALNFSLLRRLVDRMAAAATGQRVGRWSSLALIPQLLLLMGTVLAALVFLPISVVMVAVGFSVFLVSIAVETVRYVLRSPTANGSS